MSFRRTMMLGEESPTTSASELTKKIVKDLIAYKKMLVIVIISTVAVALIGLATPYILALIIDEYIMKMTVAGLPIMAGIYLLLMIGQWISQTSRSYSIQTLGQFFLNDLRNKIFMKLQKLSLKFYTSRRTGDLISVAINDTSTLNDVLVSGMLSVIGDMISLIGIVIIMIYLSPLLALVALASIPIIAFITKFFGSKLRKAYRATRRKIAEVTTIVEESIAGISVIKSFGRESSMIFSFMNVSRETVNAYMDVAKLMGFFWPLTDLATTFSIVLVLIVGGYLSLVGAVTIGIIVAFIQYVNKLSQPITQFVNMYDSLQAALAAAERIYGVLDAEEEIKEAENPVELTNPKGELVFQNVYFSYIPGRPVLRNINLRIRPGETIALVGYTGAGKTTFANLLCRFYDLDEGRILIDGVDLRKIKLRNLRKIISYIPQETYLFPGTVMDNIKMGKPDSTDREVINISEALGIHGFIERLPNGYYTDAGEAGKKLSTGEKQLIAIARAMLRKPAIVILDEALSSVDVGTEEMIKDAIKKLIEGRTSIIIAHRLTLARDADKIIVLDKEKIIEEGTHQQLMRKRGFYHKLYTIQIYSSYNK